MLAAPKPAQRAEIAGLDEKRRDIIVGGIVLLEQIFEYAPRLLGAGLLLAFLPWLVLIGVYAWFWRRVSRNLAGGAPMSAWSQRRTRSAPWPSSSSTVGSSPSSRSHSSRSTRRVFVLEVGQTSGVHVTPELASVSTICRHLCELRGQFLRARNCSGPPHPSVERA